MFLPGLIEHPGQKDTDRVTGKIYQTRASSRNKSLMDLIRGPEKNTETGGHKPGVAIQKSDLKTFKGTEYYHGQSEKFYDVGGIIRQKSKMKDPRRIAQTRYENNHAQIKDNHSFFTK